MGPLAVVAAIAKPEMISRLSIGKSACFLLCRLNTVTELGSIRNSVLTYFHTMRRHTFCRLLPLALLPMVSHAADQTSIASQYGSTANQIIDAALHDDAGYARLVTLCDRIGNRLSGSESLLRAVKWSAEEMKKAGLTHVVTPPVMVPHWVRGKESGAILSPVERPLHLLGLGMSVSTPPEGITADAVVVADFAELADLGKKVSRQDRGVQCAV